MFDRFREDLWNLPSASPGYRFIKPFFYASRLMDDTDSRIALISLSIPSRRHSAASTADAPSSCTIRACKRGFAALKLADTGNEETTFR